MKHVKRVKLSVIYLILSILRNTKLTVIFLILILGSLSTTGSAQINIGTMNEPHRAAVLQIRTSSTPGGNDTLGMKLTVVALPDTAHLNLTTNPAIHDRDTDETAIGMVVYNITDDCTAGLTPCLYVWLGDKWTPLGCTIRNCYFAPGVIYVDKDNDRLKRSDEEFVSISLGSDTIIIGTSASGGNCAENYSYQWYECPSGSCPDANATGDNIIAANGWNPIGAATAMLDYPVPNTLAAGSYRYIRKDICATESAFTNVVTVTVVPDVPLVGTIFNPCE